MKNYLFTILILSLFIGCGSNKSDQPATVEADTVAFMYSWEATDSIGTVIMTRVNTSGPDSLSIQSVIQILNGKYSNVQLQFIKSSGDTLYVSIPDASYLTQQMGSSGPQIFFAEAVYNLTEIPGIKYINFDFEEGDHASPETLSRDSFKEE